MLKFVKMSKIRRYEWRKEVRAYILLIKSNVLSKKDEHLMEKTFTEIQAANQTVTDA